MRNILILFSCISLLICQNSFSQKAVEQPSSCREMKNLYMKTENNTNYSPSLQPGDSIHATHYKINIDTIDYSTQMIKAHTELTVVAKVNNVNTIFLSLLQLNIDSIIVNNLQVFYVYDDTTLTIPTITTLNTGDSADIKIYYNGYPQTDASGWGGFYFSGTYAFNLGVGFAAIPHNFGRVWFPCIDNFTDKATYEFYINTPSTYKAFCNGELVSEISNANGTKTWYWKIDHPLPTYLACMAVAPFYTLQRNSNGIPVVWACLPTDTMTTLNTFQHLDTVLGAYINAYGTYPWNKVGYNEVPFNSGAMEHATAITVGKAFINGSLTYETLWAHELSHMWWGDKVTCKTAADMWLNEGFATFNEAFTTQNIYGLAAYKTWIRTNHHKVVQFAHVPQNDGSYLTMNNIPDTYTYGFTVYKKGGDLVHTLRNYMGDSLFFAGSHYYMNQFAYGNADSYDLRDALTAGSGINMTRFFDDWVFTPGFPHFSIDSVVYIAGGLDHYYVYTRQRSRGNSNHIYSMPVEITFANDFMDTTVTIQIDSSTQMFHIPLIGVFNWIALDRSEKISDANVDFEKTIIATGTNVMTETNVTLNVLNLGTGTNTIRVENNYVLPDGFKQSNPGIRLSDYHYWKVDGNFSQGFLSKATFYYEGSISATTGYLDNSLITGVEDSLVLLYRQGTWDDWHLINGDSLLIFAPIDKRGQIIIDTLKVGEYVLGYYDHSVNTSTISTAKNSSFTVQPNPSSSVFNFYFDLKKSNTAVLKIFDARGTTVLDTVLKPNQTNFTWNAEKFSKGIYYGTLSVNGEKIALQKIILAE